MASNNRFIGFNAISRDVNQSPKDNGGCTGIYHDISMHICIYTEMITCLSEDMIKYNVINHGVLEIHHLVR